MINQKNSVNEIRKTFINYFKTNNHQVITSSNLVPENDPTLLFTNAGMVQFKNIFTGLEHREYNKAVSSQKCLRAGGKHNDLENVGRTARHHTFFEMLGNFSFGDYFKEKAIYQAWELLTKEYAIPKEKLLVTIYHNDKEADLLWKKISGFKDDKIIKIKTSDNFWSMGDTGPCGPCSEIFMIMVIQLKVDLLVLKTRTGTGLLKFGIWYLCNMNKFLIIKELVCQNLVLIQVWG